MSKPRPSILVLLVGSNPLPNYLSACALRPDSIALLYTTETADAKRRLETQLRESGFTSFVDPAPFVSSAACSISVGRALRELPGFSDARARDSAAPTLMLNYTGGTKVMAVHARMAFANAGGQPCCASYLDGGGSQRACLRFDDGKVEYLSDYPSCILGLKTIFALHGITYIPRSPAKRAPTLDDAQKILTGVLSNRDTEVDLLQTRLYEERNRLEGTTKTNAVAEPFRPSKFGLALSIQNVPDGLHFPTKAYQQWYKFIGGEWLEDWLGEQVKASSPHTEVVVGVNASRGASSANFEVDLALARGHRSHFISCTTDATKRGCKPKLFEIVVRSRQLGGDLARAALVCLADDDVVGALQADIEDLWGASNTARVFGISDIRSWSDSSGLTNHATLEAWLET